MVAALRFTSVIVLRARLGPLAFQAMTPVHPIRLLTSFAWRFVNFWRKMPRSPRDCGIRAVGQAGPE
jgi:hypothetical protein